MLEEVIGEGESFGDGGLCAVSVCANLSIAIDTVGTGKFPNGGWVLIPL